MIESGILLVFSAGLVLQWIRAIRRGREARRRLKWPLPAQPTVWPAVSVVVPAWRERGTVEACLADLAEVDYPAFDVVVVAGGPDGTLEAAQLASAGDPRMRVVAQRPAGKSGAMNDGVQLTTGEIVVFLDADTRVTRGWLKALVAALHDGIAASTGNHVPLLDTPVTKREQKQNVLEYEIRGRVMLQGSGSFAVRREVFAVIGEFPEGVFADDWDLTWRLAQHGLRCAFATDALVFSERPADLKEWVANELRWRRIHLRSLSRVTGQLLPDPMAAARHLFPYLLAWAALGLTVGAGVAILVPELAAIRALMVELWLLFWAWCISGELATIAEVTAFTQSSEWLRVVPLAPSFVVMGFAASVTATLTAGSAPIQYKGPRRGTVPSTQEAAAEPRLAEARDR